MSARIAIRGIKATAKALDRQRLRVHRATVAGVGEETDAIKARTRAAVRRAFRRRGFRVATIVRGQVIARGPDHRVVGIVLSKWRKRGADPIAARLFGAVLRPRRGRWLAIRMPRAPASIAVARRTLKTYWITLRTGGLGLIGRGKSGRGRPRLLFVLKRSVRINPVTTPEALLGDAARRTPEAIRAHYRRRGR